MQPIAMFEGSVVEARRDINGGDNTILKAKERQVIQQIKTSINSDISGILIYFIDGKFIYNKEVKSPVSWIRKHFKLI